MRVEVFYIDRKRDKGELQPKLRRKTIVARGDIDAIVYAAENKIACGRDRDIDILATVVFQKKPKEVNV